MEHKPPEEPSYKIQSVFYWYVTAPEDKMPIHMMGSPFYKCLDLLTPMAEDHVSPPYDDWYYTSPSDDDDPFDGDSPTWDNIMNRMEAWWALYTYFVKSNWSMVVQVMFSWIHVKNLHLVLKDVVRSVLKRMGPLMSERTSRDEITVVSPTTAPSFHKDIGIYFLLLVVGFL